MNPVAAGTSPVTAECVHLRQSSTDTVSLVLARLCDIMFAYVAAWTLLVNVSYFLGGSFRALVLIGIVVCGAATAWLAHRGWRRFRTSRRPHRITRESALIAVFMLASIVLTLCLNRPDGDDRDYVAASVLVLDYPTTPIKDISVGRAFRSGIAMSSYEFLVSAVAYLTGLPIVSVYYLLVPAFFSIFVALVHWRLLRLLIDDAWPVGLCFLFVVMLAWGDAHRTHANFGFVRLFQGKAIFVSVVVPALLLYFLKYLETNQRKYAGLLISALIAGIGFTPTGIVVGLLTVGVLVAANADRLIESVRDLVFWGAILLAPVAAGLVMIFYFHHASRGASVALGVQERVTNYDTYLFVMGPGVRGLAALACFIVSPLCIRSSPIRHAYGRFVVVCTLLLLLPWTSEMISRASSTTASWRWLWMMPFPAALAIVVGRLSQIHLPRSRIPVGYVLVTAFAIVYVASDTHLVLSEENNTTFTWPAPKLEDPAEIYLRLYEQQADIRDGYLYLPGSGKRF